MKKIYLILLVLVGTLSMNAQNQTFTGVKTFTSPPKFSNLTEGAKNDSILVYGEDKILRYIPASVLLSGISVKTINSQSLVGSGDILLIQNNMNPSTSIAPSTSAIITALTAKADNAGVVHTTGNESFMGVKSAINTGTAQTNGLAFTNNGTGTTNASILLTNTSTGVGINANNTGTGMGVNVTNQIGGKGINSVNNSTGTGVYSSNISTGKGIYSINSVGGTGIQSDNTTTGKGIYSVNNSTGTGIQSDNNATGKGISSKNVTTGKGIYSSNIGSGTGIYSDNLLDGKGIQSNNNANGKGIYSSNNDVGTGIYSDNLSTGRGIISNNISTGIGIQSDNQDLGKGIVSTNILTGIGIYSDNQSTGIGVKSDNKSNGNGIYSENTAQGNGIYSHNISNGNAIVANSTSDNSFNYVGQNNGTNTFTVDKLGNIKANAFIKSGGTSSQYLMADGSVSTGGGSSSCGCETPQTIEIENPTCDPEDQPITLSSKNVVINVTYTYGGGTAGILLPPIAGTQGTHIDIIKIYNGGYGMSVSLESDDADGDVIIGTNSTFLNNSYHLSGKAVYTVRSNGVYWIVD